MSEITLYAGDRDLVQISSARFGHAITMTGEQWAQLADVILQAIADLEKIVCTKAPDDGVVLLSNKGPSHYDPEAKCHVYDHEHFSPLGDALIALHEKLAKAKGGA